LSDARGSSESDCASLHKIEKALIDFGL
jgi:hypothetical protein